MHQVLHGAVFHHHALGQAGGAGGVDHIRQVRGRQGGQLRVADGVALPGGVLQIDQRNRTEQLPGAGLGQHRHGRAVLQQVGDTLGGVRRVDRHIARASLENAQQPHQHLRAATATQCHAVIGLHAEFQQVMSQLVGPLIELLIRQRLTALLHGNAMGLALGLHFKRTVHRLAMGEVVGSGVELAQHRVALCGGQNR